MSFSWKKVWHVIIGKQEKKPVTPGEKFTSFLKTLVWAICVVTIINGALMASFVVPTGSMENTVLAGDFLFVNKFKYGPSTPQIIPFFNIPLPYYKFPGFYDPEKGDVIVFVYPGDRDEMESDEFTYYLKRCVATAGDSLEIRNNVVYTNGNKEDFPETGNRNSSNPLPAFFPEGRWTHSDFGPIYIPTEGDELLITNENYSHYQMLIRREGHDFQRRSDGFYIDGVKNDRYTVERDYCWGMGDNRDNSSDSRTFGYIPFENVVGTPMMIYWSWLPDVDHDTIIDYNHQNGQPIFKKNTFKDKTTNIRWERIFNTPD
jgi:signal peptidase I